MNMEAIRHNKLEYMTSYSVNKLVCKLAVPGMVSALVTSLYNMADTFFVGRIGTSATAGVGVAYSLMALIHAVGFYFGHGSGNYISRKLGEENYTDASHMASVSFFSGFALCVILAVSGLIFLTPLTWCLGSTETILPYAEDYIRLILIGSPFMMTSYIMNMHLRLQGNAIYSMVGIMAGAVLNVGLDPLFIFVFDMGVAGAALATILSQFVSFLVLLYGISRSGGVQIRLRNFTWGWAWHKEIFKSGLPSLTRQGGMSISSMLINIHARLYGDAAVAAFAIVNRLFNFINTITIGFNQGFQPVCGFNYGARRFDRVLKAYWFCIRFTFFCMMFLACVCAVFSPSIISIFLDDPDVIRVGSRYLRFVCVPLPLFGWTLMSSMLSQTIGETLIASVITMARHVIFLVPFIFSLPRLLGLIGLQLSSPSADICAFLLSFVLGMHVLKKIKCKAEQENRIEGLT